jgi:hypothetical protein
MELVRDEGLRDGVECLTSGRRSSITRNWIGVINPSELVADEGTTKLLGDLPADFHSVIALAAFGQRPVLILRYIADALARLLFEPHGRVAARMLAHQAELGEIRADVTPAVVSVAVPESCACAGNEAASTAHVNKAVLTVMGVSLG